MPDIDITIDDLTSPETEALVRAHKSEMLTVSPWDSSHALLMDGLRHQSITLWRATVDGHLAAMGGLKQLSPDVGEIKSMHTASAFRGRGLGLGAKLLETILETARAEGLQRISLETGTQALFAPAWHLYGRYGFEPCGPFGSYVPDPNSRFFTKRLDS